MSESPAKNSPRIAVVEDDRDMRDTTLEYLHAHGYTAWGVDSAEGFYRRLAVDPVDLVVLDIGLPGEDGISVAQHLRELPQLTVIIVSARNAIDDRLAGLSAGADRYLVKPIDFAELVANIEAVARRTNHAATAHQQTQQDLWQLEKQTWKLIAPDGKSLTLTSHEYVFLNCLFEAEGKIVPKKIISDLVFGVRALNSRERLDVQLARLRKKGRAAFGQPLPIKTVHQLGYTFTAAIAGTR
jgi:DNA-binding response OmpR family regulator